MALSQDANKTIYNFSYIDGEVNRIHQSTFEIISMVLYKL